MQMQVEEVYSTQPDLLRRQIRGLAETDSQHAVDGEPLAAVVPGSNRVSQGVLAAEVYKILATKRIDTAIFVAPSRSGTFRRLSICSVDRYLTPLGSVPVNDGIRNDLCDEDDDIYLDDRGHYHNLDVDVQLPFVQELLSGIDVVPIVMGDESPVLCEELGNAIGEIMYDRRAVVIACADWISGHDQFDVFREAFELLDYEKLERLLNSETVRFEGKGPLLEAVRAAGHRGAKQGRLLDWVAPSEYCPGSIGGLVTR